ncbi:Carboxy-terminal domain (CTD) phosphatase [Perkinsus chesapeaki]|uniref:protein-serine/threonine phosphatase n=1 Tax=Perkinsus chesapeaki TaxID=330153 RepID=A0A7J6MSV4_PERCH|nr:Carboxy-terminal domain (CTD) phosphatase [Perkinsus chesapeaki]
MLPGGDDTGGDGNERNNLISKWLLPSTDGDEHDGGRRRRRRRNRQHNPTGSHMSDREEEEEEDLISVLTNPTSVVERYATAFLGYDSLDLFRHPPDVNLFGQFDDTVPWWLTRLLEGRWDGRNINVSTITEIAVNRKSHYCSYSLKLGIAPSRELFLCTLHRSMSARPTSGGLMHSTSSSFGSALYRTSSMPFSSVPVPLDPNVYMNPETGERQVLLYRGEDSNWDLMYIKLRPGVRQLLTQCREIADLAIFSAASPDYVQFISRKLDPNGCLFDGRVYSSKELGIGFSKSTEVLPTGYDRIVIIDDSGPGIWNDVDADVCCFPSVPPYTFMRDHIADILNGIYPPDDDNFLIGELLPQLSSLSASSLS